MSPAERRLLALPRFADRADAYRPGLDRMRALMDALGNPQRQVPAVHVAGTNGKGSTASLAASVAGAAGLRVGLHTSPHVVSVRERMRVDGVPAPPEWLDGAVARLAPALDEVGPSFFEATVALSLLYVAEAGADLAVVEVGLGGRLDATNVVEPVASAVTHVGLDHTEILGETRAAIAREKAGIARPGVALLHAVEDPAGAAGGPAVAALEAEAARRGAPVEAVRQSCRADVLTSDVSGPESPLRVRLATPVADYGSVAVGLPGAHQAWNAALAVRAVEVALDRLGRPALGAAAVRAGLAEVATRAGLQGRGQAWAGDARVTLDVAHNADGWRAALGAVAVPPGATLWALVGVLADKDAGALADALARRGARALALGLDGDRALPARALADACRQRGVDVREVASAGGALELFRAQAGPRDRLLVTGSHQTVAAVLGARTRRGPTG